MKLDDWTIVTCRSCSGKGATRNPASGYMNHCRQCDGRGQVRIRVRDIKSGEKKKPFTGFGRVW